MASPTAEDFAFFEMVRFASDDPEFAEINGLEGYVAGKADGDIAGLGVFFYAIATVWDVPAAFCVSLGRIDQEVADHFAWAKAQIDKKYRDHDPQD